MSKDLLSCVCLVGMLLLSIVSMKPPKTSSLAFWSFLYEIYHAICGCVTLKPIGIVANCAEREVQLLRCKVLFYRLSQPLYSILCIPIPNVNFQEGPWGVNDYNTYRSPKLWRVAPEPTQIPSAHYGVLALLVPAQVWASINKGSCILTFPSFVVLYNEQE